MRGTLILTPPVLTRLPVDALLSRPVEPGEGGNVERRLSAQVSQLGLAVSLPTRPGRSFWRRFARNRGALGGVMILVALAVIAAIGPSLVRDPVTQNVPDRLTPPNATYWFGTDELGRDIFARVVSGAPISLISGLASVVIGLALGTLIGTIAGYVEGRTGLALMAAMDLLLALPAILLAITVAARVGPDCRRR